MGRSCGAPEPAPDRMSACRFRMTRHGSGPLAPARSSAEAGVSQPCLPDRAAQMSARSARWRWSRARRTAHRTGSGAAVAPRSVTFGDWVGGLRAVPHGRQWVNSNSNDRQQSSARCGAELVSALSAAAPSWCPSSAGATSSARCASSSRCPSPGQCAPPSSARCPPFFLSLALFLPSPHTAKARSGR